MHRYLTFIPHGCRVVSVDLSRLPTLDVALDGAAQTSRRDSIPGECGLPNGSELSLQGLLVAASMGPYTALCCACQWSGHQMRWDPENDWRGASIPDGFGTPRPPAPTNPQCRGPS